MKFISTYLFLIIIYVSAYINCSVAQDINSFQVKGTLLGSGNQKTDDVTIQLLKTADRKLVKMEFPDALGNFLFDKIAGGKYFVITQSMNFEKFQSDTITRAMSVDLGKISLERAENALKEVGFGKTSSGIKEKKWRS